MFEKSKEYIEEGIAQLPPDHRKVATLLGPGESREIPLEEIVRQFEKVYLIDIDKQSLEAARGIITETIAF